MTFKSAVDWWYYLMIVAVAIVVVVAIVPPVRTGELSLIAGIAALLLSVGMPVWFLVATHYRVSDTSLNIRCGPFSWCIPLADIESVTPSRLLWSSPALSLDRLEIRYSGGRRILVSPVNRQAFIDAIS